MRTFSASVYAVASGNSGFPAPELPEVAVVGRSNSGKSTLINTLVGQRGLARVSRQPGRTRSIIFFEVEERFLLVDLPGYGYATVSRTEQAAWSELVDGYLVSARPLRGVIALFDIRREPDELDLALLAQLGRQRRLVQAVWTKADKLSRSQRAARCSWLDRSLSTKMPGIAFSSRENLGRDALLKWVEELVVG